MTLKTEITTMKETVLTKNQSRNFFKFYTEDGQSYKIAATVRHDDQCNNGHNSFSITGRIARQDGSRWTDEMGGCIHDEISKHFPQLRQFIKWHLCSTDGPTHYIANTIYHATQHGPKSAWVYFEDKKNNIERHCVKYCDLAEALEIGNTSGYTVEVDTKTAKKANLEYARGSAIWPDATQEQLLDKNALAARLPALVAEFQQAVESLGFTY